MKIIRIESQGGLPVSVIRGRGGNWIAMCEPLALTVQSETWAFLMEDLAQALNLLFTDLLEGGELDKFMKDRGFRVLNALPPEPDDTWFDVPFSPTMRTEVDSTATLY